jgi:hypothetical protein
MPIEKVRLLIQRTDPVPRDAEAANCAAAVVLLPRRYIYTSTRPWLPWLQKLNWACS